MTDEKPQGDGSSQPWLRFAGMGMELATFTLVCTGAGLWIDSARQHERPYGAAAGAMVGFAMGMVRFIVQAHKHSSG